MFCKYSISREPDCVYWKRYVGRGREAGERVRIRMEPFHRGIDIRCHFFVGGEQKRGGVSWRSRSG